MFKAYMLFGDRDAWFMFNEVYPSFLKLMLRLFRMHMGNRGTD